MKAKTSYSLRVAVPFGLHELLLPFVTVYTTKIGFSYLSAEEQITLMNIDNAVTITRGKKALIVEFVSTNESQTNLIRRILFNMCKTRAQERINQKYQTSWGR